MIYNYFLYDENNKLIQLVKCDESEINLYGLNYLRTDLEKFEVKQNFTYFLTNGIITEVERNDNQYLLQKSNLDFEIAVSQLTSSIPQSEIATWTKQESEARAYLNDNTVVTPLIDSICEARGVTKDYLVQKIIEKADAYAVAIGTLTGQRQKTEKEIKGE